MIIDFDGVLATGAEPSEPAEGAELAEVDHQEDEEEAGGGQFSEEGMLLFFESIDPDNGEQEEALSIILDRIRNDRPELQFDGPEDLFSRPKLKVRKEMQALLASRIPVGERLTRLGDSLLKKWLERDNLHRAFMFYSKDSLVRIAATSFNTRVAANLSLDNVLAEVVQASQQAAARRNILSAENQEEEDVRSGSNIDPSAIITEVLKALLKRSFMPPLKNATTKEHCNMGHKLELPIGQKFMVQVNEKNRLPGYKCISLHKIGLVGKKSHPWAKDSIDFVACMKNECDNSLEQWGIEVKSRQVTDTITAEKEHLRRLRRTQFVKINASEAHRHIYKADERYQILHHAYVYNFSRVALVVGDSSGNVLSATVVEFDDVLLEAYGNVLKNLKDKTLGWAYDETEASDIVIPNEVLAIGKKVPTINGKEAFYGTVKLWKKMFADTEILPRPVLQRIIPRSHAKWNANKGGSDTVTKLADDCQAVPPRCWTNFETVASSRCFSNLCVAILHLYHTVSAKKNFATFYPTLQHYRDAASHRITFKKMLRHIRIYFKEEVFKPLAELQPGVENVQQVQRRPTRVRHNGIVPDQLEFAPPKTFLTPKKARRRVIEKGNGDKQIMKRTLNCQGYPYEVVDNGNKAKDPRRACYNCGAKTRWQCVKCRFHFCMEYKASGKREEKLYFVKELEKVGGTREITKIYGKSCFHRHHHTAMGQALMCQIVEDDVSELDSIGN